jgi:hypothetical protein
MAAADRLTGSDLVVKFTPDGGVITTISGDQTSFSFSRKLDTVDVTAGNERERYFKPTIESMDFSLDIFDANQSYQEDIAPRVEGLLEVFKQGVGAGLPILSFNALWTGYDEDMPFDGALEISLSGVRQGAMVADFGTTQ